MAIPVTFSSKTGQSLAGVLAQPCGESRAGAVVVLTIALNFCRACRWLAGHMGVWSWRAVLVLFWIAGGVRRVVRWIRIAIYGEREGW